MFDEIFKVGPQEVHTKHEKVHTTLQKVHAEMLSRSKSWKKDSWDGAFRGSQAKEATGSLELSSVKKLKIKESQVESSLAGSNLAG